MKILELSSAFLPSSGGVERCVWELSTRFSKRGHEVTVVTSSRGKHPAASRDRIGDIQILRFPERFHFFEAPLIPRIALESLSLDFDILHVHGMSPSITDLGIIAGRVRRKPTVLTYHNDIESDYGGVVGRIVRGIHQRLSAPIVGLCSEVVATTRSYGATSPVLRSLRKNFIVIPNGVDPERFRAAMSMERDPSRKRVLFVGQLRDYKGINFLIQAVAGLREDGYDIDLDVVGAGPSGEKLKSMVKILGVSDHVAFWGQVTEAQLVRHYADADLVVLPSLSRREAFGIVQLEAMAAGKPVVASDIPGVRDVAARGGGRLARPGDVNSLKETIRLSLEQRWDLTKFMSVAMEHSWDAVADAYIRLFDSLVPGFDQTSPLRQS